MCKTTLLVCGLALARYKNNLYLWRLKITNKTKILKNGKEQ